MTHWCVFTYRCLVGENFNKIWIIPTERSPKFVQYLAPDKIGSVVPRARWVLVCGRLKRMSLLAIPELWAIQQYSLSDFLRDSEWKWKIIHEQFSYSDLVRFCGNGCHAMSHGAFHIATLSMRRLQNYCARDQ